MIDGLYSVVFGTPQGVIGRGIVVFTSGKAKGGDLTYFYDGIVRATGGDNVEAEVKVRRYQDTGESVFGPLPEFRLRLEGPASGPRFVLSGSMVENPTAQITVQCTKLTDA
jgi:hypothetical protein